MYPWIWRHLPGPWPLKTLLTLALIVIVVSSLFLYAFPWAEQFFPFLQVTVEDEPTGAAAHAASTVVTVLAAQLG